MIQIKFRAWQKHHKEMFDVGAIQFPDPDVPTRPSFVVKRGSLETWTLDEVELMQSTGLQDCEGKEIYGGDIVSIFENREAIGSICMLYGSWQIMRGELVGGQLGMFEEDDLEVIGNVYENADLLPKSEVGT